MTYIKENLLEIKNTLPSGVTLVAVSKTKPVSDLREAYDAGQRVFGENKVQEMCDKHEVLPKDIEWHMIGHLQSNKVKYMASFVHLIHGVDSAKLLKEISKQAIKNERVINCLLQVHVAMEETKFGFSLEEIKDFVFNQFTEEEYPSVKIVGLMAMASNTEDEQQVTREFESVKAIFESLKSEKLNPFIEMEHLSMGMSGDYLQAIKCGSTMVRVGSSIFGNRNYNL